MSQPMSRSARSLFKQAVANALINATLSTARRGPTISTVERADHIADEPDEIHRHACDTRGDDREKASPRPNVSSDLAATPES